MSWYPSPVPGTAEVNDTLTRESGRILPGEIQKRMFGKSIIVDTIERGPFPNGLGKVINVLTVERSVITDPANSFAQLSDDHAWTAVGSSTNGSNTGGVCIPNVYRASYGQTQRQFQLVTDAIETDRICLNDLRTDFELEQQLGISYSSLSNAVREHLERHAIGEYIVNAANRFIISSGYQGGIQSVPLSLMPQFGFAAGTIGGQPTYVLDNTNGATNGVQYQVPNSILTQGVLDQLYLELDRECFGDGAMGQVDGGNVYGLVVSQETSKSLILNNADIRQDVRFADMGMKVESDLLKPYGAKRSYNNFMHIVCNHLPRYVLTPTVVSTAVTGWTATRVNYWAIANTNNGVQAYLNPAYYGSGLAQNVGGISGLNAQLCEVSFVMNPKVYKWLVPGTLNSPGGDTSFNTPDYFPATFSWKNIEDEFTNPDKTIGYFRAVLQAGSMPMHPEYGWALLHLVNTPSSALLSPANYGASYY